MLVLKVLYRRIRFAVSLRIAAAIAKRAPLGTIHQRGRHPRDLVQTLTAFAIRWNRIQQAARIRVQGRVQHLLNRTAFNDSPCVHDRYALGQARHHG
jgi:hypothetical protein